MSVAKNKFKTSIIVGIITLFTMLCVYFFMYYLGYGAYSIYVAVGFSLITSFFSYFFSAGIVLKMSGAKKPDPNTERYLRDIVERICKPNHIPMPKIYVIHDNAPNAFATGRTPKNSAVCVTTGILNVLDERELEGVLAHELSHIKNYDILLSTVASVMIGMVIMLANYSMRFTGFGGRRRSRDNGGLGLLMTIVGLVLMILVPIAGQLLKLALSRNREFLADASGAKLTGDPNALADALEKIDRHAEPVLRASTATAGLYISNPLRGGNFRKLFSTHPPTYERVHALRNM